MISALRISAEAVVTLESVRASSPLAVGAEAGASTRTALGARRQAARKVTFPGLTDPGALRDNSAEIPLPLKPAPKKSPSKARPASALPLPTVAEELAFLRKTFRELLTAYGAGIEGEITHLHTQVVADVESKKKLPASRLNDLRDMLMHLRSLEVKPGKGRRRDLKKVENLVGELRAIADRWE